MSTSTEKAITFVAIAYNEKYEVDMFIAALRLQTNPNWKCIIYCDGGNEYIRKAVQACEDPRFRYEQTDTVTGYWGNYNRIRALDLIDTEYMISTSIQDYYCPVAVEELLAALQDRDLVFFNGVLRSFSYTVLNSELKAGRIDIGSAATTTELTRKVNYNYPTSPLGDGYYIEECSRVPGVRIAKICKVLTLKN